MRAKRPPRGEAKRGTTPRPALASAILLPGLASASSVRTARPAPAAFTRGNASAQRVSSLATKAYQGLVGRLPCWYTDCAGHRLIRLGDEDANMYIHQIIGRAHSPEDAQQICRLFGHSLSRVQEPGYARGFCAINQQDRVTILMQEEWYNEAGIHSWRSSEAYRQLQQTLQPLMEGVWEISSYKEAT